MDNEEIFTTSFQAGRKRIYVDVKENHAGKYLKIKERGDSQSNSILIPSGSIAELRAQGGHVAKEAMPAKTKRQRQTQRNLNVADKVVDPHRVFVMNLNFDTSEADLADHCASSGEVASVELLTRGRAQRPSGSAVVEYRYAEAAAAAVDALEGTELDGRDLRVRAYFSN